MEAQTTEQNRRRLINIAHGAQQYYCIDYCVDIKGNITILGGEALDDTAAGDMFSRHATEDYIWLYDGRKRGKEITNREKEEAEKITRDKLIAAYLEFRKQHPNDGYGFIHGLQQRINGEEDDGKTMYRADIDAVRIELKRRNREYIKELYGDVLPLDYDFSREYDKQLQSR